MYYVKAVANCCLLFGLKRNRLPSYHSRDKHKILLKGIYLVDFKIEIVIKFINGIT